MPFGFSCSESAFALALANFGLLCVIAALVYALVLQVGSRTSALLACLTFLLVFGFSRYTIAGNYNFICPYSHEMTHGLLVSLAAMYFVGRFVQDGKLRDVSLCGVCVGLALLTKPEIFVAIAPAATVSLALAFRALDQNMQPPGKLLGAYLLSLAVPALLAIVLLSLAMPTADAVRGIFGAYRWLFSSQITSLPFYRETMGTRTLSATLQLIAIMVFWYAVLLGLPAGLGFLQWRTRAGQSGGRRRVLCRDGTGVHLEFCRLASRQHIATGPVCHAGRDRRRGTVVAARHRPWPPSSW